MVVDGQRCFDPHTAEHTRRLQARYAGKPGVPRAVVDLTVTRSGADTRRRLEGVVLSWNRSRAWRVLLPLGDVASALSSGQGVSASAVVTVAGSDGLTERVRVARIDLVGHREGDGPEALPTVALLTLARPVPRPTDVRAGAGDQLWEADGMDFWPRLMAAAGLERREPMRGADLDVWAYAADEALRPEASPAAGPLAMAEPADLSVAPRISLEAVANWIKCLFSPACEEVEPYDPQPVFPGRDNHRHPVPTDPSKATSTDPSKAT
jgi:hypothetical protein